MAGRTDHLLYNSHVLHTDMSVVSVSIHSLHAGQLDWSCLGNKTLLFAVRNRRLGCQKHVLNEMNTACIMRKCWDLMKPGRAVTNQTINRIHNFLSLENNVSAINRA